jgi:hypothetical protein
MARAGYDVRDELRCVRLHQQISCVIRIYGMFCFDERSVYTEWRVRVNSSTRSDVLRLARDGV